MKYIIYLIILVIVLRWISQAFRVQQTIININHNPAPPNPKPDGTSRVTGSVKTKTEDKNLGTYVDYEEVK